jgi:hypothetical protein
MGVEMKKNNCLLLVLSPIVFICLVGSILLLGYYLPVSKRSFSEADLLIDITSMPNGWKIAERIVSYPYDKEGAENLAIQNFNYSDTFYSVKAGEDVFRYRNQFAASLHYWRLEKYYLEQSARDVTPWVTPEGFSFNSNHANQWRYACAYNTFSPSPEFGDKAKICQYLAQYDEFVIKFGITMEIDESTFITQDKVQQIIQDVDERMMQYLKSE